MCCYDLSYKILPLVKNHVVGAKQSYLKPEISDCIHSSLSDSSLTKTVIENLRVSSLAEFYPEVDYQYALLKFPLEIEKKKVSFIDNIA